MKIWIIQLINYSLSFLMWSIPGRGILRLMTGNRQNIFTSAFMKITEPIYNITRKVAPFAKGVWVPVLSFAFLALLRLLVIIIFQPGTNR